MAGLALGLIETVGLAAAVEAADAAVKSANVKLIGYELTKGGGLVTIKIQGEVGAVNAAVQAGCAAAAKISRVYSSMVIPRPHDELTVIVTSRDTVGVEKEKNSEKKEIESDIEKVSHESKDIKECENQEKNKEERKDEEKESILDTETQENEKASCNLCNDPQCVRKKGEPRNLCIHHNENKNLEGGLVNG